MKPKTNFAEKSPSLLTWQKKLQKGEVKSEEIISFYLEKIKEKNQALNAYLSVNPQALDQAREADREISGAGDKKLLFEKKPLLGLPLAVKDNFCTLDLPTTAASRILENWLAPYEATVVSRLKKAGAIILGKTNMDAWAHGSSTETSDFGATSNPYDTSRVPGGSSGGSAAAVAAAMAPAAIGSETAGSIRQPAAWCGVVGLKPTYGRVSRWGLIAMASSLDCPGPLTQDVADAALLLAIISGQDPHDATSIQEPSLEIKPKPRADSSLTIGIPRQYLEIATPEVKEKIEKIISRLGKEKIKVKFISLLDPKISMAVYTIVQRAEVSSNLARYDGIRFGQNRSSFGLEAKRRIITGTFVLSAGYFDQYYLRAQKVRTKISQNFAQAFEEVDLILAPTSPSAAIEKGGQEKEPLFGEKQDILVEASSLAGLPGISLNAGFTKEGLPVGAQIIGPAKSEEKILNFACFLEKKISEK